MNNIFGSNNNSDDWRKYINSSPQQGSALTAGLQAAQKNIGNYDFNSMGNQAPGQEGLSDMSGWQNGTEGGMFGAGGGLEQLGKGVGIAGDLFGMYNQYQAIKMAKNQMNNQAKTSNYNMANNTNFKNSTASVFGSGQPQIQNQFAKTM